MDVSPVVPKTAPSSGAPGSSRLGDLGVRAASGLVMIIAAITTVRVGGTLFVAFWFAASLAILWEWQTLVGGARRWARIGVGAATFLILYWIVDPKLSPFQGSTELAVGPLGFVLALGAAAQAALAGRDRAAWAAAGSLYSGAFLVAILALRFSFPDGVRSIVWLFAVVWSTDIFAYFGGRLIGGPKLWPRVSPSKTWSGTVTGVASGAFIGTIAALRDLVEPTSLRWVFALSLAAALLSQAGDAFESAMKRQFGVKDSSRLIPGHGGVMDRLDGFVAAALFAVGVGIAHGLSSVANGLFYWP